MKIKKSIVIFTNIFPNPDNENKGIFIKQLTDSLMDFYDITVVSPVAVNPISFFKYLFKKNNYRGSVINRNGYDVYYPQYLIIPKIFRSLHWLSVFVSCYPLVKRLHRKNDINLISSHWVYPDSTAAVLIAKLLKIKITVHALGCDINNYSKYFIRRNIIKKTLLHSDLIITKSNALKKVIKDDLGISNDVKVILNGVNTDIFKKLDRKQQRDKFNIPDDIDMLLFVGNFQIEKGLDYLLDALSLALKSNINLQLYIIGGGELESKVKKRILDLNIYSHVVLLGRISHELLPGYFSAADYLCLPSLREGCPNVVIESLSCGTPVIASNVGAVPDIISSESFGFIHEAKNIKQMEGIIVKAFSSNRLTTVDDFKWYSWADNTRLVVDEFEKI